jgi:hypothetical protein
MVPMSISICSKLLFENLLLLLSRNVKATEAMVVALWPTAGHTVAILRLPKNTHTLVIKIKL